MRKPQSRFRDVSQIKLEPQIIRLDRSFSQAKSREEILEVLRENLPFTQDYIRQTAPAHDSVLIEDFYRLSQSTYVDTLSMAAEKYYGDFEEEKRQISLTFKLIKLNFPEFNPPPIYTMISGYGYDMNLTSEAYAIGLDYFMGSKSPYRPKGLPEYIFRRYGKEYLATTLSLFISQQFNRSSPTTKSMLSDMIFHGKSYYFVKKTTYRPDSLVIGYTGAEIEDCEANELAVWAHFVQNNLFYESGLQIKGKYLDERPFTGEISSKCPGRIGRWLGWRIVKAYMEKHPEISLAELMKNEDAQSIFEQSKYKPKQ